MSERKVVGLRGEVPRGEPDPDVVRVCRELLAKAECGQMRGIAACYERDDGRVTTVIETNGNHFAMSHAIGALWFRFQQKMHDDADPEK